MFKDYNQDQNVLLPPSLGEMIASDHIARLLNQVIGQMDLSSIVSTYSNELGGQKAYHPAMMLKVLVYGYLIGIRSSRKLADKLKEDIVFMWLSGRQTPDFRTIALYRKERVADLKDIFVQVVELCSNLGMVHLGKVSLDGTTILADSNKNRVEYRKVLNRRKTRIKELVDGIFAEADELDKEEDCLYQDHTPHTTGKPMGEKMKQRIKEQLDKQSIQRINKIQRKKQTLSKNVSILQAKEKIINIKLRKIRKDRNSMGNTDKDATVMMLKEKYVAPAYNAQIATEHQVILAYNLFSNRNDQKLLKPMIKKIKENNKGEKPKMIIADAGYGIKTNYRFLKNERITAFIPYSNFKSEMSLRNQGVYQPPNKPDKELERYKAIQRYRLLSEQGKGLMDRRREDVEPTFGDIKRNMNFRRFNLRGKPKCLVELGLVSIGHNLKKIKQWVKKLAEWNDGRTIGMQLGKVLGYIPVQG